MSDIVNRPFKDNFQQKGTLLLYKNNNDYKIKKHYKLYCRILTDVIKAA
jgi:hypothetical protein